MSDIQLTSELKFDYRQFETGVKTVAQLIENMNRSLMTLAESQKQRDSAMNKALQAKLKSISNALAEEFQLERNAQLRLNQEIASNMSAKFKIKDQGENEVLASLRKSLQAQEQLERNAQRQMNEQIARSMKERFDNEARQQKEYEKVAEGIQARELETFKRTQRDILAFDKEVQRQLVADRKKAAQNFQASQNKPKGDGLNRYGNIYLGDQLVNAGQRGLSDLSSIVKQGADVESMFLRVAHNTTLSSEQIRLMKEGVAKLGRESGAPLQQLADGFKHVANYGFQMHDAMQIVTAGMKSAVATGGDVGKTVDILAGVMHNFRIPVARAAETMNVLHLAAAAGNLDLEEFVKVAGRAFGAASNYGVKINDVSAAIATMTKHQFTAAQATTQVVSMQEKIVAPSVAARKAIEGLGKAAKMNLIDDFSATGLGKRGLGGVIDDIATAVKKAGRSLPDEIAKIFPAQRGRAAALVLSGNGADDYAKVRKEMQGADQVNKQYAETLASINQQLDKLKNKFQDAAGKAATALKPELQKLFTLTGNLIDAWGSLGEKGQLFIAGIVGIGSVSLVTIGGLIKFKAALDALKLAYAGITLEAGGAAAALAGPWGLAVGAAAAAVAAFVYSNKKDLEKADKDFKDYADAIKKESPYIWGKVLKDQKNATAQAKEDMAEYVEAALKGLAEIGNGVTNLVKTTFNNSKYDLNVIRGWFPSGRDANDDRPVHNGWNPNAPNTKIKPGFDISEMTPAQQDVAIAKFFYTQLPTGIKQAKKDRDAAEARAQAIIDKRDAPSIGGGGGGNKDYWKDTNLGNEALRQAADHKAKLAQIIDDVKKKINELSSTDEENQRRDAAWTRKQQAYQGVPKALRDKLYNLTIDKIDAEAAQKQLEERQARRDARNEGRQRVFDYAHPDDERMKLAQQAWSDAWNGSSAGGRILGMFDRDAKNKSLFHKAFGAGYEGAEDEYGMKMLLEGLIKRGAPNYFGSYDAGDNAEQSQKMADMLRSWGSQTQNYNDWLSDANRQRMMKIGTDYQKFKAGFMRPDGNGGLVNQFSDQQLDQMFKIEQYNKRMDEMRAKGKETAEAIASAFTGAFENAYKHGVKGFFSSLFQNIDDLMMRLSLQTINNSLTSWLSRQLGGSLAGLGGSSGGGGGGGGVFGAIQGILSQPQEPIGMYETFAPYYIAHKTISGIAGPVNLGGGSDLSQGQFSSDGRAASRGVTVNFHVQTRDAASFRQSQAQIMGDAARAMNYHLVNS